MKIKVRFFTRLKEITNKREVELEVRDDATVGDILRLLEEQYGQEFSDYIRNKMGKFRGNLQYLVNGKNVTLFQGFDTKLKESDTLAIIPPVGGG